MAALVPYLHAVTPDQALAAFTIVAGLVGSFLLVGLSAGSFLAMIGRR